MQDQENKLRSKRKRTKVTQFPEIPNKLYFSIGETAKLCAIKPYVIRFWEQVFPMLIPAKLRCGRRYYCKAEILLIRNIRTLLYDQGFTIEGACLQLNKNKGSLLVQDVTENNDCEINSPYRQQLSVFDCGNNNTAKEELLNEVITRISDIISLLEAKPEADTV